MDDANTCTELTFCRQLHKGLFTQTYTNQNCWTMLVQQFASEITSFFKWASFEPYFINNFRWSEV